MSELNNVDAAEAEAREMGWSPKDQWRGDPERWVDAEAFLDRGRQVMPILKKNNEQLLGSLQTLRAELQQVRASDAEKSETLKQLIAFQAEEVKRQVDLQLTTLKGQKRAAIKAGDHELAAEIDEDIDELKETAEARKTPTLPEAKSLPPQSEQKLEPWAQDFADKNPWLGKDKRKTALFGGICAELHETQGLVGAALAAKAKLELDDMLGSKAPASEKVEGGSGRSSNGGGGGTRGKSFSDLPSEAQAVCREQARKFVGEGKAFKDAASWEKHYIEVFFATE